MAVFYLATFEALGHRLLILRKKKAACRKEIISN